MSIEILLPVGFLIILIATFSLVLLLMPSFTLLKWPVPSVSPMSYVSVSDAGISAGSACFSELIADATVVSPVAQARCDKAARWPQRAASFSVLTSTRRRREL